MPPRPVHCSEHPFERAEHATRLWQATRAHNLQAIKAHNNVTDYRIKSELYHYEKFPQNMLNSAENAATKSEDISATQDNGGRRPRRVATRRHTAASSPPRPTTLQCKLPLHRITDILTKIRSSKLNDDRPKKSSALAFPTRVMCLFCDRTFVSGVLLQKHTERSHHISTNRRSSTRNAEHVAANKFHPGCNICNKNSAIQTATNLPALFNHLVDEHALKYFACKECKIRFSTLKLLMSHNRDIHCIGYNNSNKSSESNDLAIDTVSKAGDFNNSDDRCMSDNETLAKLISRNDKIGSQSLHSVQGTAGGNPGRLCKTSQTKLNDLSSQNSTLNNSKKLLKGKSLERKNSRRNKTPSLITKDNTTKKTFSGETLGNPIENNEEKSDFVDFEDNIIANFIIPRKESLELSKFGKKVNVDQNALIILDDFHEKKIQKSKDSTIAGGSRIQIKPDANDNQILSRLGLTQNRSPRARSLRGSRKLPLTENRACSEISRKDKTKSKNDNSDFVINKNKNDPSSKFEPDFYTNVSHNVRENLLKHLDGKLGNQNMACDLPDVLNPKIRSTHAVVQSTLSQPAEIHGSDINLNAITVFPTLLTPDQYGSDKVPHYSYGAKVQTFKKIVTKNSWKWKWDPIKKYKYCTEDGKIVRKIRPLQPISPRDLSKLDIWTQLTMREKYDRFMMPKEPVTENGQDEIPRVERQKQVNELNTILDSRVFPDIELECQLRRESSDTPDLPSPSSEPESPSTSEDSDQMIKDESIPILPFKEKLSAIGSNPIFGSLGLVAQPQSKATMNPPVLSGEWARPRCYVCCVCGRRADSLRLLEAHQAAQHPYVHATHYELVGQELLQTEVYKHLYLPGVSRDHNTIEKNKLRKETIARQIKNIPRRILNMSRSTRILRTTTRTIKSMERECTKCKKLLSPTELHRHILECAGDYGWMMAKKKCKYKPFGARKRRLKGLYKRERPQDDGDRDETKQSDIIIRPKVPARPRTKPSDAETIQRMLANLPAKRASRQILDIPSPKNRSHLNKNPGHAVHRILPSKSTRSKVISTTVITTIKGGVSKKVRCITRSVSNNIQSLRQRTFLAVKKSDIQSISNNHSKKDAIFEVKKKNDIIPKAKISKLNKKVSLLSASRQNSTLLVNENLINSKDEKVEIITKKRIPKNCVDSVSVVTEKLQKKVKLQRILRRRPVISSKIIESPTPVKSKSLKKLPFIQKRNNATKDDINSVSKSNDDHTSCSSNVENSVATEDIATKKTPHPEENEIDNNKNLNIEDLEENVNHISSLTDISTCRVKEKSKVCKKGIKFPLKWAKNKKNKKCESNNSEDKVSSLTTNTIPNVECQDRQDKDIDIDPTAGVDSDQPDVLDEVKEAEKFPDIQSTLETTLTEKDPGISSEEIMKSKRQKEFSTRHYNYSSAMNTMTDYNNILPIFRLGDFRNFEAPQFTVCSGQNLPGTSYSNFGNNFNNPENVNQAQLHFQNMQYNGNKTFHRVEEENLSYYNHGHPSYMGSYAVASNQVQVETTVESIRSLHCGYEVKSASIDKPPLFQPHKLDEYPLRNNYQSFHHYNERDLALYQNPTQLDSSFNDSVTDYTTASSDYEPSKSSKAKQSKLRRGLNDCIAMLKCKLTEKSSDEEISLTSDNSHTLSKHYDDLSQPLDLSGKIFEPEDLSGRTPQPEDLSGRIPQAEDLSIKSSVLISPIQPKKDIYSKPPNVHSKHISSKPVRKPVFDPTLRIPQYSMSQTNSYQCKGPQIKHGYLGEPKVKPRQDYSIPALIIPDRKNITKPNNAPELSLLNSINNIDVPRMSHDVPIFSHNMGDTFEKLLPIGRDDIVAQAFAQAVENSYLMRPLPQIKTKKPKKNIRKPNKISPAKVTLTSSQNKKITPRKKTVSPLTSEISTQTTVLNKEVAVQPCPPEFHNVNTDLFLIDPVTGMITERKVVDAHISASVSNLFEADDIKQLSADNKPVESIIIDLTKDSSIEDKEKVNIFENDLSAKEIIPDYSKNTTMNTVDHTKYSETSKTAFGESGTASLRAVRIKSANCKRQKSVDVSNVEELTDVGNFNTNILFKPTEGLDSITEFPNNMQEFCETLKPSTFVESAISSTRDSQRESLIIDIQENCFSLSLQEPLEPAIQQDEVSSTQHSTADDSSQCLRFDCLPNSELNIMAFKNISRNEDLKLATDNIDKKCDAVKNKPLVEDNTATINLEISTPKSKRILRNTRKTPEVSEISDKKVDEIKSCITTFKEDNINIAKKKIKNVKEKTITPIGRSIAMKHIDPEVNTTLSVNISHKTEEIVKQTLENSIHDTILDLDNQHKVSLNKLLLEENNIISETALTPSNILEFQTDDKLSGKCNKTPDNDLSKDDKEETIVRRSLRKNKTKQILTDQNQDKIISSLQSGENCNDLYLNPDVSGAAIIPGDSCKANLGKGHLSLVLSKKLDITENTYTTSSAYLSANEESDDDICLAAMAKKKFESPSPMFVAALAARKPTDEKKDETPKFNNKKLNHDISTIISNNTVLITAPTGDHHTSAKSLTKKEKNAKSLIKSHTRAVTRARKSANENLAESTVNNLQEQESFSIIQKEVFDNSKENERNETKTEDSNNFPLKKRKIKTLNSEEQCPIEPSKIDIRKNEFTRKSSRIPNYSEGFSAKSDEKIASFNSVKLSENGHLIFKMQKENVSHSNAEKPNESEIKNDVSVDTIDKNKVKKVSKSKNKHKNHEFFEKLSPPNKGNKKHHNKTKKHMVSTLCMQLEQKNNLELIIQNDNVNEIDEALNISDEIEYSDFEDISAMSLPIIPQEKEVEPSIKEKVTTLDDENKKSQLISLKKGRPKRNSKTFLQHEINESTLKSSLSNNVLTHSLKTSKKNKNSINLDSNNEQIINIDLISVSMQATIIENDQNPSTLNGRKIITDSEISIDESIPNKKSMTLKVFDKVDNNFEIITNNMSSGKISNEIIPIKDKNLKKKHKYQIEVLSLEEEIIRKMDEPNDDSGKFEEKLSRNFTKKNQMSIKDTHEIDCDTLNNKNEINESSFRTRSKQKLKRHSSIDNIPLIHLNKENFSSHAETLCIPSSKHLIECPSTVEKINNCVAKSSDVEFTDNLTNKIPKKRKNRKSVSKFMEELNSSKQLTDDDEPLAVVKESQLNYSLNTTVQEKDGFNEELLDLEISSTKQKGLNVKRVTKQFNVEDGGLILLESSSEKTNTTESLLKLQIHCNVPIERLPSDVTFGATVTQDDDKKNSKNMDESKQVKEKLKEISKVEEKINKKQKIHDAESHIHLQEATTITRQISKYLSPDEIRDIKDEEYAIGDRKKKERFLRKSKDTSIETVSNLDQVKGAGEKKNKTLKYDKSLANENTIEIIEHNTQSELIGLEQDLGKTLTEKELDINTEASVDIDCFKKTNDDKEKIKKNKNTKSSNVKIFNENVRNKNSNDSVLKDDSQIQLKETITTTSTQGVLAPSNFIPEDSSKQILLENVSCDQDPKKIKKLKKNYIPSEKPTGFSSNQNRQPFHTGKHKEFMLEPKIILQDEIKSGKMKHIDISNDKNRISANLNSKSRNGQIPAHPGNSETSEGGAPNNGYKTIEPQLLDAIKDSCLLEDYKDDVKQCKLLTSSKNSKLDYNNTKGKKVESQSNLNFDEPLSSVSETKEKDYLSSNCVSKKTTCSLSVSEKKDYGEDKIQPQTVRISQRRQTVVNCEYINKIANDEESLIQEKYLADFGMFTEKRPRKSTILAIQKISQTFKPDSSDTDDIDQKLKDNNLRRTTRPHKKRLRKTSLHRDNSISDKSETTSPVPKDILLSKDPSIPKNAPASKDVLVTNIADAETTNETSMPQNHNLSMDDSSAIYRGNDDPKQETYCTLCKRKFRRPENFMKHKSTLMHISRVSEFEASHHQDNNTTSIKNKQKNQSDFDKINTITIDTLNVGDQENNKVRKYKSLAERKSFENEAIAPVAEVSNTSASLSSHDQPPQNKEENKSNHSTAATEANVDLSRKQLSRDEALFFECCSLLKESETSRNQIMDIDFKSSHKTTKYPLTEDRCIDISLEDVSEIHNLEDKNSFGSSDVSTIDEENKKINPNLNIFQIENFKDLSMNNFSDVKEKGGNQKLIKKNKIENKTNIDLKNTDATRETISSFNHSIIDPNINTGNMPDNVYNDPYSAESLTANTNPYDHSDIGDTIVSNHDTITSKANTSMSQKTYVNKLLDPVDVNEFEDKFDKIKRKAREKAQAAQEAMLAVLSPKISSKKTSRKSHSKSRKNGKSTLSSKNLKTISKNKIINKKKVHDTENQKDPCKKVLTKGALKGFDGVKVSIPREDLNLNMLEKSKATVFQEFIDTTKEKSDSLKISTANLTTDISSQDLEKHPECTKLGLYNEKAEILEKKKNTQSKERKHYNEIHNTQVNDRNQLDIYEFFDDDDDNQMSDNFKFRTPTTLNNKEKAVSPAIKKNSETISNTMNSGKSPLNTLNEDSQISSFSFSDRDDFIYMSDDYAGSCGEETNLSSNSLEGLSNQANNEKKQKKNIREKVPRNIKKSAIMGKIFKNNAIRNDQKAQKENIANTADLDDSQAAQTDMDQLFDSLLEVSTINVVAETLEQREKITESTEVDDFYATLDDASCTKLDNMDNVNTREEDESLNEFLSDEDSEVECRTRVREGQRKIVPRLKARSTDDESSLISPQKMKNPPINRIYNMAENEMPHDLYKDNIGVASRKSQRKCTTGKQNVLVESWSSESDFEDFRQFEEYSSIPRSQHHRRPRRSGRHRQTDENKTNHHEHTNTDNGSISQKLLDSASNPIPSTSTANNFSKKFPTNVKDKEVLLSENSNKRGSSHISTDQKFENNKEQESDHQIPNKAVRKSVSFNNPPNNNTKGRNSKGKRRQSQKPFDYDDEFKPARIAEPLTTERRNKRSASEMLYYWSSSSEDEPPQAAADTSSREPEPVEQHGWIVGDSHKKLVTMLAHAKGRKVDDKANVKEKKSRPST